MKKEEIIGEAKLDEFRGKLLPPWVRELFKKQAPKVPPKIDDWIPVPPRPSDKHIWDKKTGKWVLPKIEPKVKPEPKVVPKPVKPEVRPLPKPEIEIPVRPKIFVEPKVEPPVIPKVEPKVEPKVVPKPEYRQPKLEPKLEPKPEPKPETKPEIKPEVKPPKIKVQPKEIKPKGNGPKIKPPTIASGGWGRDRPSGEREPLYKSLPRLAKSGIGDLGLRPTGEYTLYKGAHGVPTSLEEQQGYTREQYARWAVGYAKKYNVPVALALHVLNRETGGKYSAKDAATVISSAGAVGPMQLNPGEKDKYLKDLGISRKDLTNPQKNIEAGVRYLGKLYNRFDQNPELTAAAYNAGPTFIDNQRSRGGTIRVPRETYEYIYGNPEKGLTPYSPNAGTHALAYLGKDNAQKFLSSIEQPTPVAEPIAKPIAVPKVSAGTDLTSIPGDVKQGFSNIAQTAQDLAVKGYDIAAPVVKDFIKRQGPDVYQAGVDVVDAVKQKWQDFKGSTTNEEAPPGDKYERMVKHVKKGYAKDGKLTKREKGIAYATAWKLYNQSKKKKS